MIPILGCNHNDLHATCETDYRGPPFPGILKVRLHCKKCGIKFKFLGLPCGPAGVSADGQQASLQVVLENQ